MIRGDRLAALLDDLHRRLHLPANLGTDPLLHAHRYDDPADREAAALVAASFAFGNVKAMQSALESIFRVLGPRPAMALAARAPREWRNAFRGFQYRWVRAADLRLYLAWLGEAYRRWESLGALWRAGDDPCAPTILPGLQAFVDALTTLPAPGLVERRRTLRRAAGGESILPSGARLLLTAPAGGSGCKRMNLFLRWVCRPADGIDLGLWPVDPSRLVMPVDTHVMAASRILGLTTRRVADLRTALEITGALRAVRPDDPCRYDFALSRIGIMRLEEEWGRLRDA